MITGFNTDIQYKGVTYHVQTEDKGLDSPLILSLVYVGGAIIAAKRTPYEDLLAAGFDEKALTERLQRQHKLICAAIKSGRVEDLKRMSGANGGTAPPEAAAQKGAKAAGQKRKKSEPPPAEDSVPAETSAQAEEAAQTSAEKVAPAPAEKVAPAPAEKVAPAPSEAPAPAQAEALAPAASGRSAPVAVEAAPPARPVEAVPPKPSAEAAAPKPSAEVAKPKPPAEPKPSTEAAPSKSPAEAATHMNAAEAQPGAAPAPKQGDPAAAQQTAGAAAQEAGRKSAEGGRKAEPESRKAEPEGKKAEPEIIILTTLADEINALGEFQYRPAPDSKGRTEIAPHVPGRAPTPTPEPVAEAPLLQAEILEEPDEASNAIYLSLLDDEGEFRGGQLATIKIHVGRGSYGQRSVAEAAVTVKILGTAFRPIILTATTDAYGVAVVRALLPRFITGRAAIIIRAVAGEESAEMRRIIHQ